MFRFKQFSVAQSGAAMKVGTDGVLLGAWAGMAHRPARVLDIGTGTGLIALMAAQRGAGWGCRVDAVEVDPGAAAQARENFAASPWASSLTVYNADIKEFEGVDYELVLSNPPFFSDSLQAPEARRNIARHGVALSYADLVRCAAAAMRGANDGSAAPADSTRFAVIVPFERADEIIELAAAVGLHIYTRCDVYPIASKPPHRAMLEFVKGEVLSGGAGAQSFPNPAPQCTTLTIEHSPGHYTDEYMALTCDFYLKF